MVEICAFCDSKAEFQLSSKQRINNVSMEEIFSVCKACYMVLAKTPLSEKEIEKLR